MRQSRQASNAQFVSTGHDRLRDRVRSSRNFGVARRSYGYIARDVVLVMSDGRAVSGRGASARVLKADRKLAVERARFVTRWLTGAHVHVVATLAVGGPSRFRPN